MISRDIETIRRSIFRKVKGHRKRSSYPFLSGDTYQASCDVVLDSNFINQIKNHFSKDIPSRNKLFLSATHAGDFFDWILYANSYDFSKCHLVIHNGDKIPSPEKYALVSEKFDLISSVNWLGPQSIAESIPIGLENWSMYRNGVPSDFSKMQKRGLPKISDRKIELICNFSLSTNFQERKLALESGKKIPGVKIVDKAITPKKYRSYLENSKFVLSPPGNGPDCHRTWESMYLGAIPIVLRSAWPFNHLELPVLVIDSWDKLDTEINNFSISHIKGYMDWDDAFLINI